MHFEIFIDALNEVATTLNSYQGLLIVLFTFALVIFNWSLARETRRLREKATEPDIEVYIVPANGIPAVNIVVRNNGGAARDIKWTIEADAADLQKHKVRILEMELFTAQSYFPANERMEFFFGFGGNVFADPPLKPIDISVSYHNDYRDKRVTRSFCIELTPLKGRLSAGRDPLREIATRMDRLQRDIHHIATGFSKPKIITQTKAEYAAEIQELTKQSQHDETKDIEP